MKKVLHTSEAPAAIGSYSQAIQAGNTIYLSGQIPLDPQTMKLVEGDFRTQVTRVFDNLQAVTIAAGGSLDNVVRLTVYLMNLADTAIVNDVMLLYFKQPFPARTTFQVAALPKDAAVEIDAIMVI